MQKRSPQLPGWADAVKCTRCSSVNLAEEDQLRTAYKIANWRILKGAITLAPSMSPRDFTDLVKEVVKSAPENLMETLFSTHEVHVRDRSDYRWPEE